MISHKQKWQKGLLIMKQIDILNAYKELESLAQIEGYKQREQWELYKLRKQLRSGFEFYSEREQLIADKYRPLADDKGVITGQAYLDYLKEMKELDELEFDGQISKITLPLVEGINFLTVEKLENFIEFTP